MIRRIVRDKRKVLVIDFRYIDPTGRPARYRRDARVQTMTAARAEDKRLQALASETGSPVARSDSPTFDRFIADTFDRLYMPSFRESTRVRYRALLKQLATAFGSKRLGDITPMSLRAYSTELKRRGVNPRGHENLLRTVFRTAVESGALAVAPEVPRLGTAGRKLPDCPDAAEVRTILAAVPEWLQVAVALGAYAGLRSGEVRAIEARDVDLRAGLLRIRHAFSENEIDTPKSGHERLVPIAAPLLPILVRATHGKAPRDRLVITPKGNTPTRQNLLGSLKHWERKVKLGDRNVHSLRHSFCSVLAGVGVGIEAIRELAGHSSVQVTNRYVHATGADLRRAMVGMGEEES